MTDSIKLIHRCVQKCPTWLWLGLFCVLLTFHSVRVFSRTHEPGVNTEQNRGFVDFHNAIYFPVQSFLNGENPYSRGYAERHPDGRSFPLFPTHSLVLHSPFGLFSIGTARQVYFVFELVAFCSLICLILASTNQPIELRSVSILGCVAALSVPFYSQLYLGQLSFQLVFAAIVAMTQSRDRPWLAGVMLAVAACKPQFGIPIALLLLCRGNIKTVLIGGSMATTLSLIGIAVICVNFGFGEFSREIQATYLSLDSHPDVGTAIENYRRIDIYPLFARLTPVEFPTWIKFAVSASCLACGAVSIYLLGKSSLRDPISNLTVCFTTLGCIYHSHYDGLLLLFPLVSIWVSHPKLWNEISVSFKRVIVLILVLLLFNPLHLTRFQDLIGLGTPDDLAWRLGTSLSPLAMLAGTVACLTLAISMQRKPGGRASKRSVEPKQ